MAGCAGTAPKLSSGPTIRLRDIYDPKPQAVKVLIRPPGPKAPSGKEHTLKQSSSTDPPTKTIVRRRAQSLPACPHRKRELRSQQVRFVDSLGLDLEEVKVFKVQEQPQVPQHVIFRLLMSSELAFRKSLELSLPYFQPCFPENLGAGPEFLEHLRRQTVCLEQILCSEQGITGTIQVLNLAYEKKVTVHYSFTGWQTLTETTASWVSSGNPATPEAAERDIFRFRMPVPPFILQPGTFLEFAICYHVQGSSYWDNNKGRNYKLSCHSYKVTVPRECEDSMLHFTWPTGTANCKLMGFLKKNVNENSISRPNEGASAEPGTSWFNCYSSGLLISVEKMNDLTAYITFNQSGFSLIDLEGDYSQPLCCPVALKSSAVLTFYSKVSTDMIHRESRELAGANTQGRSFFYPHQTLLF